MGKKRQKYSPEFKAKVALEALKNEETISELSSRYGVHATMINGWKKALKEQAGSVFDKSKKNQKDAEVKVNELYRQIGQLKVENDFLVKGLNLLE